MARKLSKYEKYVGLLKEVTQRNQEIVKLKNQNEALTQRSEMLKHRLGGDVEDNDSTSSSSFDDDYAYQRLLLQRQQGVIDNMAETRVALEKSIREDTEKLEGKVDYYAHKHRKGQYSYDSDDREVGSERTRYRSRPPKVSMPVYDPQCTDKTVKVFMIEISSYQCTLRLRDDEMLHRHIPLMMHGQSLHWFHHQGRHYTTLSAFINAFCLYFHPPEREHHIKLQLYSLRMSDTQRASEYLNMFETLASSLLWPLDEQEVAHCCMMSLIGWYRPYLITNPPQNMHDLRLRVELLEQHKPSPPQTVNLIPNPRCIALPGCDMVICGSCGQPGHVQINCSRNPYGGNMVTPVISQFTPRSETFRPDGQSWSGNLRIQGSGFLPRQ